METKHTATPWQCLKQHEGYYEPDEDEKPHFDAKPYTRIENEQGETVVNAHDLFTFKPGDAEFIVRACNAHDELVKALQDFLTSCEAAPDLTRKMMGSSIDSARAALAKVQA